MSDALRLADAMTHYFDERGPDAEEVATELRRLHALNAELVEALRQIAMSQIPIWHRDLARETLEKVEASK